MYDFTYFECRKSSQLHVVSYFLCSFVTFEMLEICMIVYFNKFLQECQKKTETSFLNHQFKSQTGNIAFCRQSWQFCLMNWLWKNLTSNSSICEYANKIESLFTVQEKKADAKIFSIRQFTTLYSLFTSSQKSIIFLFTVKKG